MKQRDYLWCLLQLLLDEEERLDRLCSGCRQKAESLCCPVCGADGGSLAREENAGFDMERFLSLKGGGA